MKKRLGIATAAVASFAGTAVADVRFTQPPIFAVAPADPDRLVVAADTRRVHALRLSSTRKEGRSIRAVTPFGTSQIAKLKLDVRDSRVLLCDFNGVQVFDPTFVESSLFADRFEQLLRSRLPLTP